LDREFGRLICRVAIGGVLGVLSLGWGIFAFVLTKIGKFVGEMTRYAWKVPGGLTDRRRGGHGTI